MREFRGSTMYAVPSMFIEELPREGIQTIDLSASAGGTPPAIEQWRGGGDAAQQGWSDAGVRAKPAPIPQRTPATEGAGGKYVEGMLVRHGTYGQGRIIEVGGQGVLRKVKIRFASAGERTFIADKVTLEILRKG
jgi:DNA helicase II / ATP-dependent DNA helicase PcrA